MQELRKDALTKNPAIHFRRLTRREYERTMQDLLGLSGEFGGRRPEDGRSKEGFRNAGAALRMRLDQAAVVAVRHQEEFEADHQAALWLGLELARGALGALAELCRKLSPETLTMPSHPSFPERLSRVQTGPPDLLAYCYTLLG